MRVRVLLPLLLLALGGFPSVALAQAPSPPPDSAAPLTNVGPDTCATCHEDVSKQFTRSAHGQLASFERRGQGAGCESCHGPGSRHVETGAAADIRSFKALSAADGAQACLSCHRQDAALDWAASEHAGADVACTSCHGIHQSRKVDGAMRTPEGMAPVHSTAPAPRGSLVKRESELCADCHPEQRAKLAMSSHHPLREGRMTCSSCHNPHGGVQGVSMLKTTERTNDLCYSCHPSKQGPFVFEHAPVEESCLTCHDPHGTVANNLLKQGEPFLCLQCHEMHFHNARVTPSTPVSLAAGGSTNPNGTSGFMRAFGSRCTACHSRIHGSDMPSQGVSGRGKALTR